jgi:hypothetical protein
MDPKVTHLMKMVNIQDITDFKTMTTYMSVNRLKIKYANTTLEDYIWRLLRVLRTMPTFPPPMIRRYYILWLSVGGRQH